MAMYLLNEFGEILPLGRCTFWVLSNDTDALFAAMEDADFKVPKPVKLCLIQNRR